MKRLAALIAATVLLTGCTSSDSGGGLKPASEPTVTMSGSASTPEVAGVVVEIEFVNGEVVPLNKKVDVKVGEPVNLHVISDDAEEIHVHSDPEHEYEVAAGDDKTFTFTIETPGQVAVEAHHLDVTIVELVARP